MTLEKSYKRVNLLRLGSLILTLTLVAAYYLVDRRERLNGDLLDAVTEHNPAAVHRLLESGADPNAKLTGLADDDGNQPWLEKRLLRLIRTEDPQTGRTALMQAIMSDETEIAIDLIAHGANVNAKNRDGTTPIFRAVQSDNVEAVRALIRAGADTRVTDSRGYSLLMHAAHTGSPSVMQMLIASGASLKDKDPEGRTPMRIAVEARNHPVIRFCLQNGSSIAEIGSHGPLPPAGHAAIASPMIRGRPFEGGYSGSYSSNYSRLPPATSLLIAAQCGSSDLFRAAWNQGANVHRDDRTGSQALADMVSFGDETGVRLALDLGIPATGTGGASPINRAASRGELPIIRLLLSRGANANEPDSGGQAPLISAAMAGKTDAVKLLLEQGAKAAGAVGPGGMTVLHVHGLTRELARLFLSQPGIRVDARDNDGRTPLMITSRKEVAELLIAGSADVNATDHTGASVLLHAVKRLQTELVSLLVRKGADPNKADKHGISPLSEAARHNYKPLLDALRTPSLRP